MFTPTNDVVEDPISFMDPYSSLLSPFSYCGIDGYIPNYYYYHDESMSAGESIAQHLAESSNEPNANHRGDINGIVEQDNSRNNNHTSVRQLICNSRIRRSSKADRHSKIATAQGPRDRRMRLSLDVAIPFFKLLDMLGYDKPSEAIKWLLLQSKPAIEQLKKTTKHSPASCTNNDAKSAPSTPEGEEAVGSTVYYKITRETPPNVTPSSKDQKAKKTRKCSAVLKPVAKELRKKARERARERTQKKKAVSMLNVVDPAAGRCLNYEVVNLHQRHVRHKFSNDIGVDSTSQTQNLRPSSDDPYTIEQQIQYDQRIPFGTPDDFTATSSVLSANWSQLMSLNYQQEDQTCQFKPMPEFEFQGGSWEPYSYQHV